MPVLGDGVPTPDNQEPAEMPKLGDPSKVLRGHDLAMVATPCVNGKPPPMIQRRSHLTSSAGNSSESTSEPRRSKMSFADQQAKLARMAELRNLF